MLSSKREQAQMERRLVATLTAACETAKAELPGFDWLTHVVDYQHFPQSLQITWVFGNQADQDAALASGQGARMIELTTQALDEAAVVLDSVAAHVQFDNEEACARSHGGNWQQRLARKRGRG